MEKHSCPGFILDATVIIPHERIPHFPTCCALFPQMLVSLVRERTVASRGDSWRPSAPKPPRRRGHDLQETPPLTWADGQRGENRKGQAGGGRAVNIDGGAPERERCGGIHVSGGAEVAATAAGLVADPAPCHWQEAGGQRVTRQRRRKAQLRNRKEIQYGSPTRPRQVLQPFQSPGWNGGAVARRRSFVRANIWPRGEALMEVRLIYQRSPLEGCFHVSFEATCRSLLRAADPRPSGPCWAPAGL